MSEPAKTKSSFGIVGIGAAACAACCAGPILAVLSGITIVGVAGTMFVGAASLIIAVAAAVSYVFVRRRCQAVAHANKDTPVPVTFTTKPAPAGEQTAGRAAEGVR